jgi:superfamily II DNA or RNA helicase
MAARFNPMLAVHTSDLEPLTRQIADAQVPGAGDGGGVFARFPLLIARMDQLASSGDLKAQLDRCDWDLVIVDEAHRMSAHWFGAELHTTKRYQLGRLLGWHARHLLMLSATPHSGKEEDFQLFLALLDADRSGPRETAAWCPLIPS